MINLMLSKNADIFVTVLIIHHNNILYVSRTQGRCLNTFTLHTH